MRPLPGRLFISFEPDEDMLYRYGMKFGIIFPDGSKRKTRTAFCHVHSSTFDEDFTGRRIIVDRWATRPFTLIHNGKEVTFYVARQSNVLAVYEEKETQMTRDEFKNALSAVVDSIVPEDRELTDVDEDNLNDQFGEAATSILEEDGGADENEDEGEDGEKPSTN